MPPPPPPQACCTRCEDTLERSVDAAFRLLLAADASAGRLSARPTLPPAVPSGAAVPSSEVWAAAATRGELPARMRTLSDVLLTTVLEPVLCGRAVVADAAEGASAGNGACVTLVWAPPPAGLPPPPPEASCQKVGRGACVLAGRIQEEGGRRRREGRARCAWDGG
eukprot:364795-Chlamydomonas_euryale.AAC.27